MSDPRMAFLLATFLLAAPGAARSQQASPVSPGDRVRVNAPTVSSDPLVGSLVELTADTCVVIPEHAATTTRYPMASITKFEVSQGLRRHTLQGLGIGLATGAVAAAMIAAGRNDPSLDEWGEIIIGAVIVGGACVVFGGVVGALLKTERWREVPLDQLGVTVAPQSGGGLSVGLRITR